MGRGHSMYHAPPVRRQHSWKYLYAPEECLCNSYIHRRLPHRVEDRDMNDRHGTACARGTVLFPKHPRFADCNGRMIETTGIDRDLIPVTDGIYAAILSVSYLATFRRGPKPWTQCIAVTSWETLRPQEAA